MSSASAASHALFTSPATASIRSEEQTLMTMRRKSFSRGCICESDMKEHFSESERKQVQLDSGDQPVTGGSASSSLGGAPFALLETGASLMMLASARSTSGTPSRVA